MKESRQIVQMWHEGEATALVTLVRTQGSSYRRPGARLLLGPLNQYAGTISGGCLEAEVVRKAAWLVRQGAVVERYSTMVEESGETPFGLGCGGVIDLLIERTDTVEFAALMKALEDALGGAGSTILTWLPDEENELARAVLSAQGDFVFVSKGLTGAALAQVRACVLYGVEALPGRVFLEQANPPQRLFVLGAGDDAKPLVSLGALLGWTVKVLDGRPQLARAERFPEAESVSVVRSAQTELATIRRNDAVVLMTHSYEQDRDFLAAVLPLRPRYLGVLGARHRTSLLITEVAAHLGCSIAECCDHIQAPIGLNLGGDGPEVIALAVIAEIQALLTGQLPQSRKLSPSDVERFTLTIGDSQAFEQARCAMDAV